MVPKPTQKTEPSVPTLDATSKSPNALSSNPAQKNKAVTTTLKVTEAHATHRPETPDSSQPTPPPTRKPTKPDTTHSQPAGSGAQSGPSVATDHVNIQGMTPKTVPPLMSSASTAHAPSTAAPASPQQPPATAVSNPSGSSPEEPDKSTTASSSVRTSQSPGSTLQGAPTVPGKLCAFLPPKQEGTSECLCSLQLLSWRTEFTLRVTSCDTPAFLQARGPLSGPCRGQQCCVILMTAWCFGLLG